MQQVTKLHNDWSCTSVHKLLVVLAWAASEGRIDSNSDAVKTLLDQLDKPLLGQDGACSHCQIPSAKNKFEKFLNDHKTWSTQAQVMYGHGLNPR